jgi:hypothetical protein
VGREAQIKNEVEKIRHRAYALEKRGWLVRAKDGRFTPALGAVARDALRPAWSVFGHPARQPDHGCPPHHLLMVIGAAFVVAVEAA